MKGPQTRFLALLRILFLQQQLIFHRLRLIANQLLLWSVRQLRIGVQLFRRNSRIVIPTAIGAIFCCLFVSDTERLERIWVEPKESDQLLWQNYSWVELCEEENIWFQTSNFTNDNLSNYHAMGGTFWGNGFSGFTENFVPNPAEIGSHEIIYYTVDSSRIQCGPYTIQYYCNLGSESRPSWDFGEENSSTLGEGMWMGQFAEEWIDLLSLENEQTQLVGYPCGGTWEENGLQIYFDKPLQEIFPQFYAENVNIPDSLQIDGILHLRLAVIDTQEVPQSSQMYEATLIPYNQATPPPPPAPPVLKWVWALAGLLALLLATHPGFRRFFLFLLWWRRKRRQGVAPILAEVRQLISLAELEQALLKIESSLEANNQDILNQIALLQFQLQEVEKEYRLSLISFEESRVTKNKIAWSTLELVSKLD